MRRIGVLLPYIEGDSQAQARVSAFQAALGKRGWTSSRNVAFEFRFAEGQPDRLPALAADLVRASVAVIVTAGTESTDAARKATTTIPVVMAAVGDPIAAGFIASLARPGGNVTGASLLATELTAKRLELLKETLPGLTRLAVLWSAANASVIQKFKQIEAAAPVLGVQLHTFELRVPGDQPTLNKTAQTTTKALATKMALCKFTILPPRVAALWSPGSNARRTLARPH